MSYNNRTVVQNYHMELWKIRKQLKYAGLQYVSKGVSGLHFLISIRCKNRYYNQSYGKNVFCVNQWGWVEDEQQTEKKDSFQRLGTLADHFFVPYVIRCHSGQYGFFCCTLAQV